MARRARDSVIYISDESESEEEDEEDIGDLEEMNLKAPVKPRGRRNTVMAAKVKLDANWTPPDYPKNAEETELLKASTAKNILFAP